MFKRLMKIAIKLALDWPRKSKIQFNKKSLLALRDKIELDLTPTVFNKIKDFFVLSEKQKIEKAKKIVLDHIKKFKDIHWGYQDFDSEYYLKQQKEKYPEKYKHIKIDGIKINSMDYGYNRIPGMDYELYEKEFKELIEQPIKKEMDQVKTWQAIKVQILKILNQISDTLEANKEEYMSATRRNWIHLIKEKN